MVATQVCLNLAAYTLRLGEGCVYIQSNSTVSTARLRMLYENSKVRIS